MKAIIVSGALILGGVSSHAAAGELNNFEGMCRLKAKEIAAETYRGCVVENKKTQIEQLKNEYQEKIRALKEEYNGQIQRLSGTKNSSQPEMIAPDAGSSDENEVLPTSNSATPTSNTVVPSKKHSNNRSSRTHTARALPAKRKSVARQSANKTQKVDEMTVRLRPQSDDSTMDIPEPIPVESVPDSDSKI